MAKARKQTTVGQREMTETKEAKTVAVEEKTPPKLTLADRCDATRSGSEQAVVRVVSQDGKAYLQMCSHHYNKHEPTLIAQGWSMHEDVRDTAINVKPSPSATMLAEAKETPEDLD